MAILLRAPLQADDAVEHEEMTVGGGDVDRPCLERLAVLGVPGGKRARAAENARQHARPGRRDVEDDEDGGGKVAGQILEEAGEGFHSSCRGSYDDDTAADGSSLRAT
jgi:hypothetical protein